MILLQGILGSLYPKKDVFYTDDNLCRCTHEEFASSVFHLYQLYDQDNFA